MASPRRTQVEILEGLSHNIETLAAWLDQHAINQAAIVEILRMMQTELRERRNEVRREEVGSSNPITNVLGEFRKSNPSSFIGSYNLVDA